MPTDASAHRCFMSSGLVQASKTRAAGAAKVRVIMDVTY
jgi:hypothetical protein